MPVVSRAVPSGGILHAVYEEPPTKEELLDRWRDATRAANLAERLSAEAAEPGAAADDAAVDAEGVADLAEQVSAAAQRAAAKAREVATKLHALAAQGRDDARKAADSDLSVRRRIEADAREQYERDRDGHG